MHRAINEIMAIIVHSIIVISDHIIIPGLIRPGEIGQCDIAEVVGDQIVQPLPHLVGAAVCHAGAGGRIGGQAAHRRKAALGQHQDLAQKTKRKTARELKNIFRSKVPLSSIKSVNGHIKGKVYRRSPNPSTVILDKKNCTFRRELCKKRRTGFPVRQKTIHYR